MAAKSRCRKQRTSAATCWWAIAACVILSWSGPSSFATGACSRARLQCVVWRKAEPLRDGPQLNGGGDAQEGLQPAKGFAEKDVKDTEQLQKRDAPELKDEGLPEATEDAAIKNVVYERDISGFPGVTDENIQALQHELAFYTVGALSHLTPDALDSLLASSMPDARDRTRFMNNVIADCREVLSAETKAAPASSSLSSRLVAWMSRQFRKILDPRQVISLQSISRLETRPDADSWQQAEPLTLKTVNEAAYMAMLAPISNRIRAAFEGRSNVLRSSTVLLASQNGMGTGKSHMVDTLGQMLDVTRDGVTLKVSYNLDQLLTVDVANLDDDSHVQTLLTRIALATRLEKATDVEDVLHGSGWISARIKEVARFLDKEFQGQAILLAVDELQLLVRKVAQRTQYETALDKGSEILSCLRKLCEEINSLRGWDIVAACVALVTALPTLDLSTASRYPPVRVDPVLFTELAAKQLLQELEKTFGKLAVDLRLQVLTLSGGPLRSVS